MGERTVNIQEPLDHSARAGANTQSLHAFGSARLSFVGPRKPTIQEQGDFIVTTVARQRQIEGVDFVVDVAGERKAVLIDLRRHRELWEDFYDTLLVHKRANEPRESLDEVKKKVLG